MISETEDEVTNPSTTPLDTTTKTIITTTATATTPRTTTTATTARPIPQSPRYEGKEGERKEEEEEEAAVSTNIDPRSVSIASIKFPLDTANLVPQQAMDGRSSSKQSTVLLIKRMNSQFKLNSITLGSQRSVELLANGVTNIPGVVKFNTDFFPGFVGETSRIEAHQMILRLENKIPYEDSEGNGKEVNERGPRKHEHFPLDKSFRFKSEEEFR